MIDLTKSPTAAQMARLIWEAKFSGPRNGHLETASELGLELAYKLPGNFGASASWDLDIESSQESGKAHLWGDDGAEVRLPWAKFRLVATPVD